MSPALVACGDSGAGETDSDTDDTLGETETAGEPLYDLGEKVSQDCVDAMAQLDAFTAAAGDATSMSAAYEGTALQAYIQRLDGENARTDDSAITTALAGGGELELIDAELWVHYALLEGLRTYVAAPEGGVMDPYHVWDDAHCIWSGAWKSVAETAEGWSGSYTDVIVADVDAAFATGHDGILGDPPAASIDEWVVPPQKQVIEKNQYRAIHRHVTHFASLAQTNGDALAARRALRWFEMFEHRLDGRNTAGITIVKDMLAGDPGAVDAAVILREINDAFAKRTRGYASLAIEGGELGVPGGYKGAVEGSVYTKLLYPDMVDAGFDIAGLEASWDGYKQAIRDDDMAAAQQHSDALVTAYCDYQVQTLGIETCTAGADG